MLSICQVKPFERPFPTLFHSLFWLTRIVAKSSLTALAANVLLFLLVRAFLMLLISETWTVLICDRVIDNRQAEMYDGLKQGSHNSGKHKLTGYLNIIKKNRNRSGGVVSFTWRCFAGEAGPAASSCVPTCRSTTRLGQKNRHVRGANIPLNGYEESTVVECGGSYERKCGNVSGDDRVATRR